jgi:hypothetical protein
MKLFACYFLVTSALLFCFTGCNTDDVPTNKNTVTNNPPTVPVNPFPPDSAVNIDDSTALELTWESTDPDFNDTLKFDLFVGTSLPLSYVPLAPNLTVASFNMGLLVPGITYYWKVTAKDNHGATATGEIWRFTIRTRP